MRGFLSGIVFTVALILAAAITGIYTGVLYPGADVKPPWVERWAARTSQRATFSHGPRTLQPPIDANDANLAAGVKLYGEHCAVCHGASDGKASSIARGLYVRAPQFARHGVEDDPVGVSYWKIAHGLRFTAMPAFENTLTDREIWQIALFVKAMNAMPPDAGARWKALPSVAASGAPVEPETGAPAVTPPAVSPTASSPAASPPSQ